MVPTSSWGGHGGGRDRLFGEEQESNSTTVIDSAANRIRMAAIHRHPDRKSVAANGGRRRFVGLAPPPTRVRSYAWYAGSIVYRRNLLNKPDNSAAQFRVLDAHESLCQSHA